MVNDAGGCCKMRKNTKGAEKFQNVSKLVFSRDNGQSKSIVTDFDEKGLMKSDSNECC